MERFNLNKHWNEFINGDGLGVNCPTEELANEFLRYCDSKGLHWIDSGKLTENNEWSDFEKDTVYFCEYDREIAYDSIGYLRKSEKYVEFHGFESL